MVRIGGPVAGGVPRQAQQRSSSDFAVPDQPVVSGKSREVRSAGMANTISGAMMLTLQQSGSREQADEDARRQGRNLLQELTQLQSALLSGSDDVSLDRLEALSRIKPVDIDPVLAGALSSIRLRARIELARRGRVVPNI